ncbi:MAG TPA: pitrilysin family protein [Vulgatibacter sp.]|nr:pitrilysin family protein [Vulgatibacter sp.]
MRRSLPFAAALAATAFLAAGCAASQTVPDAAPLADPEAWRATPPAPGEPPELVTPRFERFELPNGLQVLVSERHELPIVSVGVALRAGSAADPEGKEGLAQLTYQLLLEGAGKRDAVALDDAFADIGTSASVSVTEDGALVGTQVLTRNLEEAMSLLADIVQRPRLERASFELRKKQQLANLAAQVGNPRYLAGEAFAAAAFGAHHPYGRLGSGTPASVARLQVADAKRFYERAAGPKAAAIVFAGDITAERARELAQTSFGSWKGKAVAPQVPKAPEVAARARVVVVPKPGLSQTVIMMGRPAIAVGDPDEFDLNLASMVFGGTFGSRLNMNLREDKGYTYGARSYVDSRLGVGPIVASSAVRADVTGAAIAEFMKEMHDLDTRPISEDELEAAREGRIRSLPGSFETVGGLAYAAASLFWYDLPLDRFERLVEGYEAATPETVQAAARRYLDPSMMQIVLVGDPEIVSEQVGSMGLGPIVEYALDAAPAMRGKAGGK